jgi:hypothetical protein
LVAVTLPVGAAAPADTRQTGSAEGLEFFETRIRPVLVDTCYKCHGPEAAEAGKLKGELRLDSREGMLKGGESGKPAVVPGNADASLLVRALRHTDPDLQMPPKKKLAERQIADFVTWVNLGAPDPRNGATQADPLKAGTPADAKTHWAFQPPSDQPLPQVKTAGWAKTPVDAFLLAKLESKNLVPSPEADQRTLIRRATYDLTGLPPTPQEVDAFLADTSSDAYNKLIDRLLASPRYGERWGRYWLDLARYSDTKGYVYSDREEVQFVHAHAYRDWVIKALNNDLPYDQFLLKQIAADQLEPKATGAGTAGGTSDHSDLAAMGFLTVGRRFLGIPHDIIDDRIDVVTRTTQGLTVACARCHDHKFDPIPTQDYYSLYGVFANSSERTTPIVGSPPQTKEYAEYLAELKKRTDKLESTFKAKRDEMVGRLRRRAPDYLVAVLDADKMPNELFYENVDPDDLNRIVIRQWQQYLFRRGRLPFDPVFAVWHALAALPANEIKSKAPDVIKALGVDEKNRLNPLVAKAFAEAPPASMTDVAKTYGKLLAEVDKAWREVHENPTLTGLPDPHQEQLRQILYGPDSPATIPDGEIVDVEWFFPEGTRVELGKLQMEIDKLKITHPGAPDHAVYLVDRDTIVRPRVFKRGNPATKAEEVPIQYLSVVAGQKRETFTHGSGRLEMAKAIASPSNPLTARVMVNRIWAWHFGTGLVNTPSDFGTRAEPPSHPELLDWFARRFVSDGWSIKKLHKLIMTSAAYRQQSGADNPAAASADPSNKLLWHFNRRRLDFEAMRDSLLYVTAELDPAAGGRPVDMFKSTRRSVYGKVDRQFLPGVFRVFDFANPDLHIPTRPVTTVPQQALFFMNSTFVTDRAKALASRSEVAAAASPAEKVQRLYRLAYQRDPTPQQVQTSLLFVEASGAPKTPAPPPKPIVTAWQYGYGELDPAAKKMKSFEKLGHFTGSAWQGGIEWPDTKLGWVQLTADGGHAGNDLAHAAVRRWTAPRDGTVAIRGRIAHKHEEGDGIVASIVSSRDGLLASYTLHNRAAEAGVEPVVVKQGDTIDFVVDYRANLNNDDFYWAPVIEALDKSQDGKSQSWDAKKEFAGNAPPPPQPLTAWEQLAQVLLESNEFLFVD